MTHRHRLRLGVERLEGRRLMAVGRFAVIGDYGADTPNEGRVAELIDDWNVDLVLTVGDNNYGIGSADTIDRNIGKYYQKYIGNYQGSYGPGSEVNRFFPSLGNHDWWYPGIESIDPYLNYFTLPGEGYVGSSGNERYYDFVHGGVHFFAVNSDYHEPDGVSYLSPQGAWLRSSLAASREQFNIVYFHHPPFTSGIENGDTDNMRWPFAEWGADAVLSGHEHIYERLFFDGIPYFISGLGGASIYPIGEDIDPFSQFQYNKDFGALLITAGPTSLRFEFYAASNGSVSIDRFTIFGVPEPAGISLAVVGIVGGMALIARRGRAKDLTAVVDQATAAPCCQP